MNYLKAILVVLVAFVLGYTMLRLVAGYDDTHARFGSIMGLIGFVLYRVYEVEAEMNKKLEK